MEQPAEGGAGDQPAAVPEHGVPPGAGEERCRTRPDAEQHGGGVGGDERDALDLVHGAGVAHRDVKPANIFVLRPSDATAMGVKLLDFGVAKVMAEQEALASSLFVTGRDGSFGA